MIKVTINKNQCVGCGACAAVAEDFFEIGQDGKARLKEEVEKETEKTNQEEAIRITKAEQNCSVKAISIEDIA